MEPLIGDLLFQVGSVSWVINIHWNISIGSIETISSSTFIELLMSISDILSLYLKERFSNLAQQI